jgi:ketosteroid isomerase-like protein
MSANVEKVRRFYDAYNRRDWDAVAGMLAPSVEWFHAARAELVSGVDGVIALLRSSADAFPDARVEVRAIHEAGDFVITECAFTRPAAAASQQATFCEIERFENGKCIRGSTYADTLQILLELECRSAA